MVVVGVLNSLSTNTPAFQKYTFNSMFQQATNLIASWDLDLPRPLTTNMVTAFKAGAYVDGINGVITFSNRYDFGWRNGGFDIFYDRPNIRERTLSPSVDANDAFLEQWMRATNLLTMEKAQRIAEAAIQSAGAPMDKPEFRKPAKTRQMTYEWKDGKKYPMPYYGFWWQTNGFKYGEGNYEVHVSGIVSNIVELYCFQRYLKPINPTNYFEMLGLPSNPIFVKRMPSPPGHQEYLLLYDPNQPHKP